MALFASLVANAVIAATPATPLPWYNFQDYPQKAFDREWQGTTTMAVLIDPAGRVADCSVVKSSGYAELDKQTCWVAMRRVKFSPAIDPNGQRAYGLYRSNVIWSRPDRDFGSDGPGSRSRGQGECPACRNHAARGREARLLCRCAGQPFVVHGASGKRAPTKGAFGCCLQRSVRQAAAHACVGRQRSRSRREDRCGPIYRSGNKSGTAGLTAHVPYVIVDLHVEYEEQRQQRGGECHLPETRARSLQVMCACLFAHFSTSDAGR